MLNGGPSQLKVGGVQISCNVIAIRSDGTVESTPFLVADQTYRVQLVITDPSHYQPDVGNVQEIQLLEGSQLVAVGIREAGDVMVPMPEETQRFLRQGLPKTTG